MLWIKTFHIVFVASWFAGLFYLPRIFVNMAQQQDPQTQKVLIGMSRRLFRFLPFQQSLWVCGFILAMASDEVPAMAGCTPNWCLLFWRWVTTMVAECCCVILKRVATRTHMFFIAGSMKLLY
jgi:uncharacterized membrane protein